jgi:hypothetical protein
MTCDSDAVRRKRGSLTDGEAGLLYCDNGLSRSYRGSAVELKNDLLSREDGHPSEYDGKSQRAEECPIPPASVRRSWVPSARMLLELMLLNLPDHQPEKCCDDVRPVNILISYFAV